MKIFLHIGTHKTGSTAIQHHLSHNRKRLAENGILYPRIGRDRFAHHEVAWAVRAKPGAKLPRKVGPEVLKELTDRLSSTNCHTAILSSEEFEFVIAADQVKLLKRTLGSDDVRVLVYVRRQDKLLVSEYNQHLRMSDTRFSGSIFDFFMRNNFAGRMNYLQLLNRWADAFGAENVILRPFEPEQFVNGNLMQDVEASLGIADAGLQLPPRLSENRGLSSGASMILSLANRRKLDVDAHVALVSLLHAYDAACAANGVKLLSARNARDILASFGQQNKEVARKYLRREDGVLFREPLPVEGEYGEQDLPADGALDHAVSLLVSIARDKGRAMSG